MPIYEYECLECGERFELRQSVKDEPVKKCVKCGGGARRVIHPVGIIFKGSGFYATDNRRPHYGEGAKSSDGSKSEKGETAKLDSGSGKEETKSGKEESKTPAGSAA
jgi:putative FmdB family regulatory protein